MSELLDRDKAEAFADAVLGARAVNHWFLPGTRERIIEAATHNTSKAAIVDVVSDILFECEIDDPGGDPCDECWHDRWFYYHPAMVL